MVAKFKVADWRDILRVCGTIAASNPKDRIVTQYLDFHFNGPECCVYGSNGAQISRIVVPCVNQDIPPEYRLLVPPMKIPARTRSVEIHIDDGIKEYEVICLDSEDDVIDAVRSSFCACDLPDYGSFFDKVWKDIDVYNNGEGKYFIAVNPKYLMNALEGLKSCDHVILNFANRHQPFMIRPYGDEYIDVTAMVCPVRLV